MQQFSLVTPCVGVWIETLANLAESVPVGSHPAWVCGLKPTSSDNVGK